MKGATCQGSCRSLLKSDHYKLAIDITLLLRHLPKHLLLIILIAGCATSPQEPQDPLHTKSRIDSLINPLIQTGQLNGISVGVIKDGVVGSVSTFGWRNVENDLPLTESSVMYGASLTKTAVAFVVMQLVDEGLLDLDESIESLLPKPLTMYDDYGDL